MKKIIEYKYPILFLTIILLIFSSVYYYPFFLKGTLKTESVIIDFKEDYALNFKYPVAAWNYQYIFKTKNKYVVDRAVCKKSKTMFRGKKLEIKYAKSNPLLNETTKYFSKNGKEYFRKFSSTSDKNYSEIELIQGYFIKKIFERYNVIREKKYGEYEKNGDTINIFFNPDKKKIEVKYLLTKNNLIELETLKKFELKN